MTATLVRKLLRDVRVPLAGLGLLLGGYQFLWVKVTERISFQLMPLLLWLGQGRDVTAEQIERTLFGGPGQITKVLMGGAGISLFRVADMVTVGLVHPVTLTMLCIWAVGRAAGAIAGEIDRGTMELLLAQPLARSRVILAHLGVDLIVIPVLCLCVWAGHALGMWVWDLREVGPSPREPGLPIDPAAFGPGLWNLAGLLFAVSGLTLWLSAAGRFRWRVLGVAVFVLLAQFLTNLCGQLWQALAPLRPFTVFYYYQPQRIILQHEYRVELGEVWNGGEPLLAVNVLAVLFTAGAAGYLMALWTFCRRDLPAPL